MPNAVKICVLGKDNKNWSTDMDRHYLIRAIRANGYELTNAIEKADILWTVWYSHLLSKRYFLNRFQFKRKRLIAMVSNHIADNREKFNKVKAYIDFWVCANSKQSEFLQSNGIAENRIFYSPFYVDENIFRKIDISKEDLCVKLKISSDKIKNKILIGSFQRDSKGKDLLKPKWHKNPEMLVDEAEMLHKSDARYTLLLAGPRRHYLVNECRKRKLPFIFVGDISYIDKKKDDVIANNLSLEKINLLYNLCDLYRVTSVSEGGPKALLEAPLTDTPVFSSDVGMASDILPEYALCKSSKEFIKRATKIITDSSKKEKLTADSKAKVSRINNRKAYKSRIDYILQKVKSF